jgi:hypothetical protein
VSVGVKVTLSLGVPPLGTIVGVVQANVPLPEPPLNVDDASVWPYVIALAVGHADTIGVALFTVTLAEPATVL